MFFKTIISATLIFVIDRVLKFLAVTSGDGYFIFNNTFGFKLVENTGIAFNIPIPHFLFVPLNIIFLGMLIVFVFLANKWRHETGWCVTQAERVALAFMIAGGLSNVYDRLYYEVVIDYLIIRFNAHSFAFNVADIAVVTGALFLILLPTYEKQRRTKSSNHL
jgi:signal peptidase II